MRETKHRGRSRATKDRMTEKCKCLLAQSGEWREEWKWDATRSARWHQSAETWIFGESHRDSFRKKSEPIDRHNLNYKWQSRLQESIESISKTEWSESSFSDQQTEMPRWLFFGAFFCKCEDENGWRWGERNMQQRQSEAENNSGTNGPTIDQISLNRPIVDNTKREFNWMFLEVNRKNLHFQSCRSIRDFEMVDTIRASASFLLPVSLCALSL